MVTIRNRREGAQVVPREDSECPDSKAELIAWPAGIARHAVAARALVPAEFTQRGRVQVLERGHHLVGVNAAGHGAALP